MRLPLKLAAGIGVSLVAFLLLELIARMALGAVRPDYRLYDKMFSHHKDFVEDKDLFWRLPPNIHTIAWQTRLDSNSFGLREEEFPLKKPKNTYRILSLGESGTFGVGVESAETYSKQLDSLLNRRFHGENRRYQVINAGFPSYSSFQGLMYLKKYGLQFEPDMILLYFLGNDSLPSYFVVSSTSTDWKDLFDIQLSGPGLTDRELHEGRKYFYEIDRRLRRSVLYQHASGLTSRLRNQLFARLHPGDVVTKGPMKKNLRKRRVSEEERRWVFNQFIEIAQENNIELVVLIPPYNYQSPDQKAFEWLPLSKHVHVLDLGAVFRKTPKEAAKKLFPAPGNPHPTPLGHRLAAEAIHDFLIKEILAP